LINYFSFLFSFAPKRQEIFLHQMRHTPLRPLARNGGAGVCFKNLSGCAEKKKGISMQFCYKSSLRWRSVLICKIARAATGLH
jgi:hypothetical protein